LNSLKHNFYKNKKMKKIFLQMGIVTALLGGVYSVGLALPLQQIDLQQQNQIQFQAQPQMNQIPNLNFDPNAGGVLGNPPIDHKTNVTAKAGSLISAIKKASTRIEGAKYLSTQDKEAILEVINDTQKKADKIKNDAENQQNFNQAIQEQFMLKIGSLFGALRLEIPKIIIEKQSKESWQMASKFGVISDKISIYISIAKKQGSTVDDAEDKWTQGNKRLANAYSHLDAANKLIEKIKPGVDFDKAKGYLGDANKKFRLARKDIKMAKLLLGESVVELKKAIKE
jgi:hypothetical protein